MEKIKIKDKDKIITDFSDLRDYDVKSELYNERIGSFLNDIERFDIQPYFQRHFVWKKSQMCNFIATILTGLSMPAVYTYIDHETGKEVVIDGQQRLLTIKKFRNTDFELTGLKDSRLNGFSYRTLPPELKLRFENYKIPIAQIINVKDMNIVYKLFENYNTGGTKLNKQEIRNCVYQGNYINLIKKLSKYKSFDNLFKLKLNEPDRMVSEEYVLRFIALYQDFDKYNGNMNKFLEQHLKEKDSLDEKSYAEVEKDLKILIQKLKKAVDNCYDVFGKNAFKNCIYYGKNNSQVRQVMYKTVSKAVYDMQMLGFVDIDSDLIIRHKKRIKEKYEELVLNNEQMRPYYKRMSKKAMEYRIKNWKKEIEEIVKNP